MSRPSIDHRTRVNVFISTNVLTGIKLLAKMQSITYSELIRKAIYDYVLTKGPGIIAKANTMKGILK